MDRPAKLPGRGFGGVAELVGSKRGSHPLCRIRGLGSAANEIGNGGPVSGLTPGFGIFRSFWAGSPLDFPGCAVS